MKNILFAGAAAAFLAAAPVHAQPKAAVAGAEVDAMVTVIAIDKAKRTVTFRGPRGNEVEMQVPPEAPNFDQVKKGAIFHVKYAEAVAVAISRGGAPSKSDETKVKVGEKGKNPGGVAIRTRTISGVIDSIDATNRYVALRGPKQTVSLKVGDDVNLSELNVGDRISIAYTQALAMEMVPQPKKPKPEAKKKS
jgi:Cu/Ag efflux protein CusF